MQGPLVWESYYYDTSLRLNSPACNAINNSQTGECTVYAYDTASRLTTIVLPKRQTSWPK